MAFNRYCDAEGSCHLAALTRALFGTTGVSEREKLTRSMFATVNPRAVRGRGGNDRCECDGRSGGIDFSIRLSVITDMVIAPHSLGRGAVLPAANGESRPVHWGPGGNAVLCNAGSVTQALRKALNQQNRSRQAAWRAVGPGRVNPGPRLPPAVGRVHDVVVAASGRAS